MTDGFLWVPEESCRRLGEQQHAGGGRSWILLPPIVECCIFGVNISILHLLAWPSRRPTQLSCVPAKSSTTRMTHADKTPATLTRPST
ncbi:hypothetical protein ACRAWF_07740 [Streptomyces sp. L7]